MGALNLAEWHQLPVTLSELCINTTLRCGQSFRWRKSDAGVWSIAIYNRILSVHQDSSNLYYRSIPPSALQPETPPTPPSSVPSSPPPCDTDTLDVVQHYFNLSPNLSANSLYTHWSSKDANFASKAPRFTGIRILQQPAWEALIGFICSSNNNIARISQMVHKLCLHYGPLIGHIDDEPYHDFPPPEALAHEGVEAELRRLGFGYRARYISQTAVMVSEKGDGWLDALRNPESPALGLPPRRGEPFTPAGREGYRTAHESLLALQGVGPKVADCVCLMGLGWGEAVPVDTHVWQIAQRDYGFGRGRHASLTRPTYDAVANRFRSLWGQEAGWAQSVLFTANLRAFSERLVAKTETVAVKEEEDGEEGGVAEVVKTEKVLEKAIKREHEEEERTVIEVEEKVVRSKKRRRN